MPVKDPQVSQENNLKDDTVHNPTLPIKSKQRPGAVKTYRAYFPRSSSESTIDSPRATAVKQFKCSDAKNHVALQSEVAHLTNGFSHEDLSVALSDEKQEHVIQNGIKGGRRVAMGRTGRRGKKGAQVSRRLVPTQGAVEEEQEGVEDVEKNGGCDLNKSRSNSVPATKTPQKSSKHSRAEPQKQLITDFFPIRRSSRMTTSQIKKQEQEDIEDMILSHREDALKVVQIEGKGRGVRARQCFSKGDFVVEYAGELVDRVVAKDREAKYSTDQKLGCYMYYFNYKDRGYCVDATAETSRKGRLINHSRLNPNCTTKIVELNGIPRLILVALRRVEVDEELLYDYGDRNRETLDAHPWLAY